MTMLFALLLAGADARFEASGVRFGDVLVSGAVLELRAGALVSGSVVEPLTEAVRLDAGSGLALILEPGVRATRTAEGIRLSVHAPAKLRMSTGESADAVLVAKTETGWSHAGEIRVSVQAGQQEDPDAALRAMQESAKRMRESSQRVRPPMMRRVFTTGNPFTASEAAGSEAIRQLAELSLTGS